MDFQIEITNKVDNDLWIENLLKNSSSSTYQTPYWSKTYFETFNSKPVFVTVKNNENDIVGQLSGLLHTKYFWADSNIISKTIGSKLNLGSMIFWRYGPIIHDQKNYEQITSEIFLALNNFAIKNNVSFIRGSFSPLSKQPSESFLQELGYEVKRWSTYVTPLNQNPDELFASLDKSVRYDVRKAQKNKLEFEVSNDVSMLHQYAKLKYEAKGRAGHKRGKVPLFYEKEWENLHKKGFAKLLVAKHNGVPINAILCFVFNKNVIQHGVVNSENIKFQGGSFVTWNALKWFIENNENTFDMSGVNPEPVSKKEEKIDFFKSKWGGKKYDYLTFIKIIDKQKAKLSFALKDPKKIIAKITSL